LEKEECQKHNLSLKIDNLIVWERMELAEKLLSDGKEVSEEDQMTDDALEFAETTLSDGKEVSAEDKMTDGGLDENTE
jgi:hypothetical protein